MEKQSFRHYDIYMKNVHISRQEAAKTYDWDKEIKVTQHIPSTRRIENLNEVKGFLQAYLNLRKVEIDDNHFKRSSDNKGQEKSEKKVTFNKKDDNEDADSFKTSSSWGSFTA